MSFVGILALLSSSSVTCVLQRDVSLTYHTGTQADPIIPWDNLLSSSSLKFHGHDNRGLVFGHPDVQKAFGAEVAVA